MCRITKRPDLRQGLGHYSARSRLSRNWFDFDISGNPELRKDNCLNGQAIATLVGTKPRSSKILRPTDSAHLCRRPVFRQNAYFEMPAEADRQRPIGPRDFLFRCLLYLSRRFPAVLRLCLTIASRSNAPPISS